MAIPALALDDIAVVDNLQSIYDTAISDDPVLRGAIAAAKASTQVKKQARGTLFPSLSASAAWNQNNRDVSQSDFVGLKSNYSSSGYGLVLNQPVFRKELWARSTQGSLGEKAEFQNLEFAKQDLIIRVLDLYFGVLGAVDSLEFAKAEKIAVGRQLDQVSKRFTVGMIPITDVQESQARYDLTVAQEIAAQNAVQQSLEGLQEVTGRTHDKLLPLGDHVPLSKPEPSHIADWVEIALKNNLAVKIAKLNLQIAKSKISQQRSGYYPSVDIVGRYNHSEDDGSFAIQESDTSSIGVSVGYSLYQGGQRYARIKEAQHRYSQSQHNLEAQIRNATRQTRVAYLNAVAAISRVNALKQALKSSETALKATQAGFDVGTRTSVDILDAQRELFRAKRDYAQARYDYILNLMRLKKAAGTLAAEDISRVNTWLK